MLSEKIFQMFIAGTGNNLKYALKHGLGGVIFFKDDILSEEQFQNLVTQIKNTSIIPPFLSIDQEGGRVERTENIHPKKYLSPMYAYKKGDEYLSKQTDEMLSELCKYGINMNFAPCLDVNSNPNNPIIGERAFSDNPNDVCNGFDIVYPIYKCHDIIPVIKHFPGHGDADKDSHKELPIIDISFDDMEKIHIYPFKHAICSGADVVMVAHLNCKCFNGDDTPTSLSTNCIDYLRKSLNFNGLVISDDMYMNGLSKYSMTEACQMGIMTGINMFIYRDSSDKTLEVIENIINLAEKDSEVRERINYSHNKVIELKRKYDLI